MTKETYMVKPDKIHISDSSSNNLCRKMEDWMLPIADKYVKILEKLVFHS